MELKLLRGSQDHSRRGLLTGKWPSVGVERWSICGERGGSVSLCLRSPKTKWVLRLLQCKLAKRLSLLLREIDSRHMGGGGGGGVGGITQRGTSGL